MTSELTHAPHEPLDARGIGHLGHFERLATMRSGEWDLIGEGLGWLTLLDRTLRYQIANMAYAVAVVQHGVTPAYREYGQRTMRALMRRLMEPDCWEEWINVSRGGALQDPDQRELKAGSIDPLERYSIMYGGHPLQVAGLHESLYAEGAVSRPGGLTLDFLEGTWGFGPYRFEYDTAKLASSFASQFADADFEGCPCEPTLTFPECPQHAVLGGMLSDHACGTSLAPTLRRRYLEFFQRGESPDPETGSFRLLLRRTAPGREFLTGPPAAWVDGWTGAFMAAWAPECIDGVCPRQRDRHVRHLVDRRRTGVPYSQWESTAGLGYFAVCAAEVGDTDTVQRLIGVADQHYGPVCWHRVACYDPRHDDSVTREDGVLPLLSALAGNALIPFARLLPPRALWRLHNQPWTAEQRLRPTVGGIDMQKAGLALAPYTDAAGSIDLHLVPGPLPSHELTFEIEGLEPGERVGMPDTGAGPSCMATADQLGRLALTVDGTLALRLQVERLH